MYDYSNDLKCDYEILTDEICSIIGLLRAFINDKNLTEELIKINEIIYHMNTCLRAKTTVAKKELKWIGSRNITYEEEAKYKFNKFVIPQGCIQVSYAHAIRTKCKA